MPRAGAGPDLGDLPLPQGWDLGKDFDGKVYFIDHHNQKTTWVDPRDRYPTLGRENQHRILSCFA